MNNIYTQEIIIHNNIVGSIRTTLYDLVKGLRGSISSGSGLVMGSLYKTIVE